MPIHRTEMKSFSTTHTTTKSISSYTGIKSSSIPHTEIKVNLDRPHEIEVDLHAHTKNKGFSPRVQKLCQFRLPVMKLPPEWGLVLPWIRLCSMGQDPTTVQADYRVTRSLTNVLV